MAAASPLLELDVARLGQSLGASPFDGVGCVLRDDADAALCNSERHLGLDITFEQVVIGEYRPHLGRAEHILEDVAVEDGGGHLLLLIFTNGPEAYLSRPLRFMRHPTDTDRPIHGPRSRHA